MRPPVPAIALSLCAALAASSPIPEPDALGIDPSKIRVDSITFTGTGCSTTGIGNFSPGPAWKTFTLEFDDVTVSTGPRFPSSDRRKDCNTNIKLQYPTGYQFAIDGAKFSGYATLDEGVKLTHLVDYRLAGKPPSKKLKAQLVGPSHGPYSLHDAFDPSAWAWSSCGPSESVDLINSLSLDNFMNPEGSGKVGGEFFYPLETQYGIQWRNCK